MFGKKADLAEKSQTMTDWRTHHQGQRVFCFSVIFRVCLISKTTKESHSKMQKLHRRCLKVHHSKLLQSFTSPSSPHCKLTLITGLAKFRGWLFFFTKGQGEFEVDFRIDHGPGKIHGWMFIDREGTATTAYFWKITTKSVFSDGFYCKMEFQSGFVLLHFFIWVHLHKLFFDVCKNTQIKPKIHQNWNLAKIAPKREKIFK